MRNSFTIAKNTFREVIRDRILYGIVAFAVLYIIFTLFLGELSLDDVVAIKSFGLAGIYLFGIVITVFLGASIVYKEIDRRTLYFVLSKPASFWDVVCGKFLGLLAAVALTMLLMLAVYLGVIMYVSATFDVVGILAVGLQVFEMAVLTALLIFFSSFLTPLASTMGALVVVFAGHALVFAVANTRHAGHIAKALVGAAYYILPNLEKFNVRDLVVHKIMPSAHALLAAGVYGIAYAILLLYASYLLLRRREL